VTETEELCEGCDELPEHGNDDTYVENPSAVDDWIDPADLEDHNAAAAEDLDDDDVDEDDLIENETGEEDES